MISRHRPHFRLATNRGFMLFGEFPGLRPALEFGDCAIRYVLPSSDIDGFQPPSIAKSPRGYWGDAHLAAKVLKGPNWGVLCLARIT